MVLAPPPGAALRVAAVLAVAAACAATALVAALAGPAEFGEPRWSLLRDDPGSARDAVTRPPPDPGAAEPPTTLSAPGWLLPAAALLVAMALVLLARRLLARRPVERAAAPRPQPPARDGAEVPPRLARTAASAAARLRVAARTASVPSDDVVRVWCALEQAAAGAGSPRGPAQTPSEFTAGVLTDHHADPAAVGELLRLYHRARFGRAALPPGSGERAADALARVALSLRGRDG